MGIRITPDQSAPHAYRLIYCVCCGFRLDVPIDCGFRFCIPCSKRRAFRVRNRLQWIFDNFRPQPGYMLKMITLSTSNCKQLEPGVTHLISSFRRLRQRNVWRDHVSGGATIIEIKGRPNNWHPHLHILCYSLRLPWRPLRDAWMSVSGGTACYIQNVDTERAKFYVTKYITKADVPAFLLRGLSKVLVKYRLFQRFGDWHSLTIPKKLYDYPCPNCSRSDWLPEQVLSSLHRSRSPPGYTKKPTPVLTERDINWRSPRIWPHI
ncbi:hypothetical protein ES703_96165 [subsurface metagenome]